MPRAQASQKREDFLAFVNLITCERVSTISFSQDVAMRALLRLLCFCHLTCCLPAHSVAEDAQEPLAVVSPNGRLRATVKLVDGNPAFDVRYADVHIVAGLLGLQLAGANPLRENLKIAGIRRASRDETYAIPVGKASSARDHHHELIVSLAETQSPRRKLDLAFRAFDDGVAFRYLLPKQVSLGEFALTEEDARLSFPGNPQATALPLASHTTSYEAYYETKAVSDLPADRLFGLPMLLAHPKKVWFAMTEANLTDYAGMYLSAKTSEPGVLVAKLSPLPGRKDGVKVLGKPPHAWPWRVIMVADNPGRLIESNLVFHLSEPTAIKDTSWIKPGTTTFPWWNHYVLKGVDFKPGVNTATMKHYIDFCAEQGIPYHSLDGLDIAWYGGPIQPSGPTDVTKAAPSIDLPDVLRYAKEKNFGCGSGCIGRRSSRNSTKPSARTKNGASKE